MIKKLVLIFAILFAIQNYAQQGIASPYSFYGIGSLKFKGTVENASMGGLSIYKDSIHLNLRNPATYGGNNMSVYPFNGESRPVKFSVGGSSTATNLKTNEAEAKANATTFDYLAMSIPIGKLGIGFGLLPYTAVGYKLENRNVNGSLNERFKGEGGLNKVFISAGYQFTENFSAGIDANYNFGNIQNSTIQLLYNEQDELLASQARENNRSNLSGLNINFGFHYKRMLNEKLELQSAFTFSPASNLTSKNERTFSNIIIDASTGNELEINTIDAGLEASGLDETDLKLPSKFSIGAGLGEKNKWFTGLEYTKQNTSTFSNILYENIGSEFEDASVFSIGGFFIPQYNSLSSYFKRVVYRSGMRFEKTGLVVQNLSIREFGMSFGVGLPVGRLFSNTNIGIEIGNRGTKNGNLIKENFIKFQLSLSLNDRWFNKRKYD